MQAYQINELERLTGIKAHTIRIWEKRYELITPSRTDTNRRYYNDKQVLKLLNVATLIAKGHKISKIAAYNDDQFNAYIQAGTSKLPHEDRCATFVNDLVKAMLTFNETSIDETINIAFQELGVYDTMLNVIYPFLHKTGMLWTVNKVAPMQEHFASCIVRRKLITVTDGLPPADTSKNKFLLFLPPGEWHELGLLFANYIIRAAGHNTIYLGQNVPMENVHNITSTILPGHVLLFYIAQRPKAEIEKQLINLSNISKQVEILVAGEQNLFPEIKPALKNIKYLADVNDLKSFI